MRGRLQAIVLSLVGLLVFGLGVPLALTVAAGEQQSLFLDRLTDTTRFAALAQRPVTDDQPESLRDELGRYQEVYGISVAVFGRDRLAAVSSSDPADPGSGVLASDAVARAVDTALAGRRSEVGSRLLPWDDEPLVLSAPVLVDGEVRGAVVTVSPTDTARERVLWWWVLILAGSVVAFLLALVVALPIVRWVLRPVLRLDEATGALVGAVVGGREVDPVGDGSGPPELRKLSRSFDQMAASVYDALAAQRSFVADASHQLRNPLTALKLRLVNLDGHVDAEAEVHREAAVAESNRLKRILDELLAMARAESAAGEPVAVDVDRVVAERIEEWRVVADHEGVRLTTVGGAHGARALISARGLDAVLDALLDNALKFTPRGAGVEVAVRVRGERLTVAVRDHGPGLPVEELDRATDRFWRSPGHQNVPGSGLGLAIVSRIAARAGGSVALNLPDGGGLRVSVELAVADGGAAPAQTLTSR